MSVDMVNHPPHYTYGGIEVIEITRLLSFDIGNAIKYILRHEHKGNPKQDLEKALWYLEDHVLKFGNKYQMPEDARLLMKRFVESMTPGKYWDDLDVVLMELRQGFVNIAAWKLSQYITRHYA